MTATLKFELVCEAIAPDGTRTRVGGFPIPACCLICGGRTYDDTYRMWASIATVNNQTGLVCHNHGGGRRAASRGRTTPPTGPTQPRNSATRASPSLTLWPAA